MNAKHPPGCALALIWIGWFTFPFWAPLLGHFSNRLWTLQEASFGSYGWVPVVAVLWVAPLLVWTPLAQWNLPFSEHPWRLRAAWALMAGMAGFLGTGMLRTFGNCAFDRSPANRVTVIQVQSRKHVRFRIVDGPPPGRRSAPPPRSGESRGCGTTSLASRSFIAAAWACSGARSRSELAVVLAAASTAGNGTCRPRRRDAARTRLGFPHCARTQQRSSPTAPPCRHGCPRWPAGAA